MRERDATSPFRIVCQPEGIPAAVAFLVWEDGRNVTHQRLIVDGGGV